MPATSPLLNRPLRSEAEVNKVRLNSQISRIRYMVGNAFAVDYTKLTMADSAADTFPAKTARRLAMDIAVTVLGADAIEHIAEHFNTTPAGVQSAIEWIKDRAAHDHRFKTAREFLRPSCANVLSFDARPYAETRPSDTEAAI